MLEDFIYVQLNLTERRFHHKQLTLRTISLKSISLHSSQGALHE